MNDAVTVTLQWGEGFGREIAYEVSIGHDEIKWKQDDVPYAYARSVTDWLKMTFAHDYDLFDCTMVQTGTADPNHFNAQVILRRKCKHGREA